MSAVRVDALRFNWLRTFVAFVREGNQTRAAKALGMTQPMVSSHLERLEGWLGTKLLERNRRAITPEGAQFVPVAESVVTLVQACRKNAPGDIGQLSTTWFQSLAALVQHGGYHDAARSLGWNQSSVSRNLQHFEEWMGVPLFRHFSPPVLTPEGEACLQTGEQILALLAAHRSATANDRPSSAQPVVKKSNDRHLLDIYISMRKLKELKDWDLPPEVDAVYAKLHRKFGNRVQGTEAKPKTPIPEVSPEEWDRLSKKP